MIKIIRIFFFLNSPLLFQNQTESYDVFQDKKMWREIGSYSDISSSSEKKIQEIDKCYEKF